MRASGFKERKFGQKAKCSALTGQVSYQLVQIRVCVLCQLLLEHKKVWNLILEPVGW